MSGPEWAAWSVAMASLALLGLDQWLSAHRRRAAVEAGDRR